MMFYGFVLITTPLIELVNLLIYVLVFLNIVYISLIKITFKIE